MNGLVNAVAKFTVERPWTALGIAALTGAAAALATDKYLIPKTKSLIEDWRTKSEAGKR